MNITLSREVTRDRFLLAIKSQCDFLASQAVAGEISSEPGELLESMVGGILAILDGSDLTIPGSSVILLSKEEDVLPTYSPCDIAGSLRSRYNTIVDQSAKNDLDEVLTVALENQALVVNHLQGLMGVEPNT